MNPVLIGILFYIVLQLLLGILVSGRIRTEADYLLAGRRLGYGLATFSIFAMAADDKRRRDHGKT